jgi:hypothetical protein
MDAKQNIIHENAYNNFTDKYTTTHTKICCQTLGVIYVKEPHFKVIEYIGTNGYYLYCTRWTILPPAYTHMHITRAWTVAIHLCYYVETVYCCWIFKHQTWLGAISDRTITLFIVDGYSFHTRTKFGAALCVSWRTIRHWTKAVNMKNGVFWDVTPSDSCKNRRFEET